MKKALGSVVTIVVFGLIALRVLSTWGYIGGALQPGGGGKVSKAPTIDPAEVTVGMVAGRWMHDPGERGKRDYTIALYLDGTYETTWCEKGVPLPDKTPERGTWDVQEGWIWLCRPTGGMWLGRVEYAPERYLTLQTKNGGVATFERLSLMTDLGGGNIADPATTPPVPAQMPGEGK